LAGEAESISPKGSSTLGVDGFVAVLAVCHILGVCFCVA